MTAADWASAAKQRSQLETSSLARRLAVLGSFDPRRIDDADVAEILRSCALRLPRSDDREEWMLTESVRIAALAGALLDGGMAALIQLRRGAEPHFAGPLQAALDLWLGLQPPRALSAYSDNDLVASAHVARWARAALVQAGLPLGLYTGPDPDDIEDLLALHEVTRPVRWLVRNPVIGRDRELDALEGYLAEPSYGSLRDDPAFCLHGIGGVGKSTLVAAFVTRLATQFKARPWAYLDFDRRTLKPGDPFSLVVDLYRQIGAQFAQLTKLADRMRAELLERERTSGARSGDGFREAIHALAKTLISERLSPLVVVVDTCEEVQRTPGAIEQLYDVFDALAVAHGELKLVVSGRARVPQFESSSRPDRVLALGGLDPPNAAAFLEVQINLARRERAPADPEIDTTAQPERGDLAGFTLPGGGMAPGNAVSTALARMAGSLDAEIFAAVVGLVGGNPLSLALAARVLVHDELAVVTGAAERARALGRVRDEFIRGFLYRRVLDHLQGRDARRRGWLRDIARASLVLRHVTRPLIEQVLKPAVHAPAEITADDLYRDLVAEVAFVEAAGDVLRLREDVRGPALDALQLEDKALVACVHEAARDFYAAHDSTPHARVERLYHALALGEVAALAGLDRETLYDLDRSAADFPAEVAEKLRDLVAGAPSADAALAQEDEQRGWERSALGRADSELRAKNLRAARKLLFERTARTAGTELHRIESRLFEAEGELDDALDAARKEQAAAVHAANAERFAVAAIRVAALLERMERGADALAALEEADRSPLLTGNTALRLELLLHRMTTAERTELWSDDERWVPGLEARRRVRALGSRVDANPTLVRLLAAALGRDEPAYLRRALQRVGLGEEAAPRRIDDLAREIMRWDGDVGDKLASAAGLVGRRESQTWRNRISVLGGPAGDLLFELWSVETPPRRVCEAMRAFYLWWGIPFAVTDRRSSRHFLEDPLDFGRSEVGEFERLIVTAYPKSSDLRALCRAIELDETRFDFALPARYVIRDLLDEAARRGRMPEVVQRALRDLPPSASAELRTLVGADWGPLRVKHTILFLAANPAGTQQLALDREARAIQHELERSGFRDQFELVTRWAVEPLDLLRELRKLKPTVVHYSGHGKEGLFFQEADGTPRLIAPEALAQTFGVAGGSVRIVLLSACYSQSAAEALLRHVDCVLGTASAISDEAARHFAVGFYGGLGEGESVASAANQGRAAISLEGLIEAPPLLLVRPDVDPTRLVLAGKASTALP